MAMFVLSVAKKETAEAFIYCSVICNELKKNFMSPKRIFSLTNKEEIEERECRH